MIFLTFEMFVYGRIAFKRAHLRNINHNPILRKGYCNEVIKSNLAIIGVGPTGLFAALRAAQKGIKNIIAIDNNPIIGGTCVNHGCIPTKCLLKFSQAYKEVKSGHLAIQGVITSELKLDLDQMMRTKAQVSRKLGEYIECQFKTQGIQIVKGKAEICDCNKVSVCDKDGKDTIIEAQIILIATGSMSKEFPGIKIDEEYIVSSNGAIQLRRVPKSMAIIGAGVISLELGCIWSRLGTKVTIYTQDDVIISNRMDIDIRKKYREIMEKQGITFEFGAKLLCAEKCDNFISFQISDNDGTNVKELECETLVIAVGRTPYTRNLCLERVGISIDKAGYIPVNNCYQTCCPNIYAAGDVIQGPMTAHKAIEDGILMIDGLFGKNEILETNYIPMAVYTHPEAACVGKTEEDLKKENVSYRVSWSTFKSCSRAHTDLDTTGYIKAIICAETGRILGTHIVGDQAGEIINEAALAQQFGLTAEHLARALHAHPTYTRMLKIAFSQFI